MGKKWGLYKAVGRSQPVACIYCGRLVPRIKAVVVRKGFRIDPRIPGIDRRRVFSSGFKAYSCISCAKHRRIL